MRELLALLEQGPSAGGLADALVAVGQMQLGAQRLLQRLAGLQLSAAIGVVAGRDERHAVIEERLSRSFFARSALSLQTTAERESEHADRQAEDESKAV